MTSWPTILLLIALVTLSSCTTIWIQSAPEDLSDGSSLRFTEFVRKYRSDIFRLDREDQSERESFYVFENLPSDFEDGVIVRSDRDSVTVRFRDSAGRTISDQRVNFDRFTDSKN